MAMPADDDVLRVVSDLAIETAVDAVPFQEVREGFGVREIIDGGDLFDLRLAHGAQDVAPDAAEAIDSDSWHEGDGLLKRSASGDGRVFEGLR